MRGACGAQPLGDSELDLLMAVGTRVAGGQCWNCRYRYRCSDGHASAGSVRVHAAITSPRRSVLGDTAIDPLMSLLTITKPVVDRTRLGFHGATARVAFGLLDAGDSLSGWHVNEYVSCRAAFDDDAYTVDCRTALNDLRSRTPCARMCATDVARHLPTTAPAFLTRERLQQHAQDNKGAQRSS